MPVDLRDVRAAALAAKVRVCLHEDRLGGGLRVSRRAAEERRLLSATQYLDRLAIWHGWAQDSFVSTLDDALRTAVDRLGAGHPLLCRSATDAARASCQSALTVKLRDSESEGAMRHARRRLGRRQLPLVEGKQVDGLYRRLNSLANLVPPRVVAARTRTAFNGWVICRRVQGKGQCCLGCSGDDSIDQYAHCRQLKRSLGATLGFATPDVRDGFASIRWLGLT